MSANHATVGFTLETPHGAKTDSQLVHVSSATKNNEKVLQRNVIAKY